MEIRYEHQPIPPGDWHKRRPERPDQASRANDPARTQDPHAPAPPADPAPPKSKDAIHKEHVLRETVNRLIESGDLRAAEDGSVRQDRVDDVKRKLEAGTYKQDDVIGGIVDRLLQQWKI